MMKQVLIVRNNSDKRQGTTGALSIDGETICVTLECFDQNNTPYVSCIPEGHYYCTPHETRKGDWRVNDVPNRTGILFHVGNTLDDIEGCILFGTSFHSKGVASSSMARDKFNAIVKGEFHLTIKNGWE